MPKALTLFVAAPAPAKDGGSSIFNSAHPHHPRVVALREAMRQTLATQQPFEGVPLRLEVVYQRATCKADGLNVINGIADVLQRRPTAAAYASDVWAIDDDANIREFAYREIRAESDAYEVVITPLV